MTILGNNQSPVRKIRSYLARWVTWWQNTSVTWKYQELLQRFIDVCWHETACNYAIGLYQLNFIESHNWPLRSEIATAA